VAPAQFSLMTVFADVAKLGERDAAKRRSQHLEAGLAENARRGRNMNRSSSGFFATLFFLAAAASGSPAAAQSFQSYRCADGTQFIVGFFEYDKRAHLQIDGRAVTLGRRVALSGAHYAGGGVTLKITRAGTTVKHARRPETACELT
jgi:membrane-bound inhibitor of C-type lysozyme